MPDQAKPDVFASKLRLALDALNWSRAQCARELRVDKSVISRWASGATQPSEQNLTRLTGKLREIQPRFPASAWRLDAESFAALLQPDHAAAAVPTETVLSANRNGGPPSIAVLAFDNLSGDPADSYFADGMAEDLITELSRSRSWLVVSRNASFTFKGAPVDIRQVGAALGVRYVLEGSIRRAGDRIRVTVQLIEAESRVHVWAERYDGALTDLFATQDDITGAVTRAIEPAVESAERSRLLRRHPDSLDAWEAWQRARSHFDTEQFHLIDACLQRSIALDPGFAAPHASRSFLLHLLTVEGRLPFHPSVEEGQAESRLAIKLDPADSAGYAGLSMCQGLLRDPTGPLQHARRAVELGPSVWTSRCAMSLALIGARQFDEAGHHVERLLQIGPRGAGRRTTWMLVAGLHFLRGDYDKAAAEAASVIAAHPSYGHAYRVLVAALGQLGRRAEAAAALARWVTVAPGQIAQLAERGVPWWDPADSDRAVAGIRAAGWDG